MTNSRPESPYLAAPAGTQQEEWFRPMGLNLRLVTDSPEILAAAEEAFGRFGRCEPNSSDKSPEPPDATYRLFAHDVDDPPDFLLRPLLRCDGHLVYQTAGRGATLVFDRSTGTAFGYFSPAALADRAVFRWHFLDLAFFFVLEEHGFLGVHGAALARGGRGLLLRAPSGQGKSTLTYAAARRRFQAVAEDIVWIAPGTSTLWGMPWSFHLLPDAARLFPELDGLAPSRQLNGEEKVAVDLERLRPGSTAASAEPAGVVLLHRRPGSRSRLKALSPSEAWDEWLAGGASREREIPGYDRRATALLRDRPIHRLELGDDLEAALDLLELLLPRENS
jgi:hypothetical protein